MGESKHRGIPPISLVASGGAPAQIDLSMAPRSADCKKRLAGELVRRDFRQVLRHFTANKFAG
jgi:hypothetical protein